MVEIRRRREPHCRLLAIGSSKNDPKPGKKTGTADAPCFQKVVSLFSLCYLLLEKSSKSLIPLSDCPRSCSIASLFFLKISLFPGKNRHGLRLGLLSRQGDLLQSACWRSLPPTSDAAATAAVDQIKSSKINRRRRCVRSAPPRARPSRARTCVQR